jgi:flagellar hook-basal body complex protein FliE
MSIEAIAAVGGQLAAVAPSGLAGAPGLVPASPDVAALASLESMLPAQSASGGEGLFDKLVSSIGEIDSGMAKSGSATTELALGQSENLHHALIGAERTRMQFELAMSMRNRVLEAYQEIMRMQV